MSVGRLRIAFIAGVLCALLVTGCEGSGGDERAALELFEPAPDFALPLVSGGVVELAKQRGKLVILDFWATWCAPCEVQMPILDALWREVGDERLMIVGISVDTDPAAAVAAWVAERGFDYPIALGDQDLAMRYGVLGFPSVVLIDPQGRIQARHIGVWSREEIEERLDSIRRAAPVEESVEP